jgi:hypothetical protein
MPISTLYGTLNQLRRMAIYKEFCETDMGVLIATDIAARGLGEELLALPFVETIRVSVEVMNQTVFSGNVI